MSNYTLDDYIQAYEELKSTSLVAKKLGVNPRTVRRRLEKYKKEKQFAGNIKGTSTLYDADGNVKLTWVKESNNKLSEEDLISIIEKRIPKIKPVARLPKQEKLVTSDVDCIPIGDLHVGMLAWAEETGKNYNVDLADAIFSNCFNELIINRRMSDTLVIAQLGDFFHCDNFKGITSESGHFLDTDTRLQKMVDIGVSILINAISVARLYYNKIHVINAVGNHDGQLVHTLNLILNYAFSSVDEVIIEMSPRKRHYYQFGKVMLGVLHSDKIALPKIPLVAAEEASEIWGNTKYRYILRGHHHTEDVKEYPGCVVRCFRTLAPADSYAYSHGFLSKQDIRLLSFNSKYGLINESIVTPAMMGVE